MSVLPAKLLPPSLGLNLQNTSSRLIGPERSEGAKRKSAARKAAREAAAAKVRRMQAGEDVESDTSDPGAPAAQLGYGADL